MKKLNFKIFCKTTRAGKHTFLNVTKIKDSTRNAGTTFNKKFFHIIKYHMNLYKVFPDEMWEYDRSYLPLPALPCRLQICLIGKPLTHQAVKRSGGNFGNIKK